MNDTVISVERLAKKYLISHRRNSGDGLRHAFEDALLAPFKLLTRRKRPPASTKEEFWALKNVNFEVKRGEVLGIIGRNGAGKSTLLKILSRITEPTEGRVQLRGRLASLLEVGTGFHPELTGRENVFLNGAILGMTRAEIRRRFDEIVAFAEVERFLDTPVKRYSSGMYVRLAFAVAAHLEAEILLVDEVLAVGDTAFQKKCLGKMEDVSRSKGRTVLFVSHNMAMMQNLCQRAILLDQGSVSEDGPISDVVASYVTAMTNLAGTELAERKDRQGRGEIRIVGMQFLTSRGEPLEHPVSGQELVIRLRYRSFFSKVFRNCKVSVACIRNEIPYFNLSTELVDSRPLDLSGDGCIDFIVPELPLSQSTYLLHSYIAANGEIQDWVINAAEMQVIDGDFYGTGRNYPSESWRGVGVLVKHSWRLSSFGEEATESEEFANTQNSC